MNTRHLRVLIAFAALLATPLARADWPQFRGPTQQGYVEGPAPTVWGEEQNVLWKTPLPGRGWSSPVVLGDQIWMTTAVEQSATAEEAKAAAAGLAGSSKMKMNLARKLSLRALCVDRRTGRVVRDIELFAPESVDVIHTLNSYASPTPVVEPGRLYCHFGTYGNACVDTSTGEVVWRKVLPLQHYVGPGSSPVVHGGRMILTCDGADVQYVAALDCATGDVAWKMPRPPLRTDEPDFKKSYCTPLVIEYEGQAQVLVTGAQWFVAYDPATGEELWRVDHGNGFSVVPRPVVADGVVYFTTGYGDTKMVAVRLGGSGDVTDTHVLWRVKKQTPTQPSPLLVAGRIFTVSDNGVGIGLDAATGEQVWRGRLGGTYSASPLLVGDRVLFFSREGKTTAVDLAGGRPNVSHTNQIAERQMATPAIKDGVMYLRSEQSLYAISDTQQTSL
ncbi:MAG: PQQ-binding-like beta-propeller repeat protein [Planctomycetota bacterium]